uniref:Transposon protein, putative, unclassified n=1 Tax=Oryza sativa subsp. japonica TaxID=39947 RepID=Q10NU1_ORYSJ|nr:transposon protein, putative, unclassified [Oryza sativa Japonica Group]
MGRGSRVGDNGIEGCVATQQGATGEGVHFTHTTLLTRITQPVGISHVGRPPSFHDKAFRKPSQVYHMPTRGVPDQQQELVLKCEIGKPYTRVHDFRGATGWLQGNMAQDVQRWLALLEIWSLILEILALRVFGLRNYTRNGTTQQTAKIKPYLSVTWDREYRD